MEILVNPDGTRNKDWRPQVDQEEYLRYVHLYDPYRPPRYGLYDRDGPCACPSFQNYFNRTKPHTPLYSLRGDMVVSPPAMAGKVMNGSKRYANITRAYDKYQGVIGGPPA